MKRLILILSSLLFVLNTALGQNGWLWGKVDIAHKAALGGTAAIAVDQLGNTYLCGGVQDSVYPYCSNIFLAKYDVSGNLLWYKTAGGRWYDEALAVTLDGLGNVYITGYMGWDGGGGWAISDTVYFDNTVLVTSYYDIFIAKYDSNGDLVWAKKYGGDHGDIGMTIKADTIGNLYFSGRYAGDNYPNPGTAAFDTITLTSWQDGDIFLAKVDTSGAIKWAKTIGSSDGADIGYSIAFDSLGEIYLSGSFGGNKCRFGSYELNSLSSGYVAGNVFIAKYDSSGNFIWAQTIGGINNSSNTGGAVDGARVAVTSGGKVFVSGSYIHCNMNFGSYILPNATSTSEQIFLAQYNSLGQLQWANGFGGESDDAASALATGEDGHIYITGYYGDDICFGGDTLQWKGGKDVFIACFDSAGNHVMSSAVANAGSEYATGIVVKNGGDDIYISGIAAGDSMMFGNIKVYPGLVARNFVAHANKLTGIAPLSDTHLVSVYPNPANKRLYFSGLSEKTLVYVYDINGRVVYQQYVNSQQQPGSLNLESLSRGTYILKLLSKEHVFSTKIILR
jgi:hypothetical protein